LETSPPSTPTLHAPENSANDPLQEAPDAVWYVRAATGGQFGPASAEIMRNWLKEGRVPANSLVWRAGWQEWRSASSTFGQLAAWAPPPTAGPLQQATPIMAPANGMPPLPSAMPVGHVVQSVAPLPPTLESNSAMTPLTQAARKRRRKNDAALMISGVLVV